jgi:hypothetical protein
MVREGGRQGMQHMILELEVPSSVAESPVQPHKSWSISLVTPRESSILKFQLLQLTSGEGSSEKTHQTEV